MPFMNSFAMRLAETTTDASLETLKAAFGFVTYTMGTMCTTILSQAIFLIPVGIFTAGAAIGLCGRLIGR